MKKLFKIPGDFKPSLTLKILWYSSDIMILVAIIFSFLFIVKTANATSSPYLVDTTCHGVLVYWQDPPEIPNVFNSGGYLWFEGDYAPLDIVYLYPLQSSTGGYYWGAIFDSWDIDFAARNYWKIYGYVIINGNNYYLQDAEHWTCGVQLPFLENTILFPLDK